MKKNTIKKNLLLLTTLTTPVVAAAFINNTWFINVIGGVHTVVSRLVPILLGLALLVFIWGVVRFMTTDEDRVRDAGKRHMLWGVIGLFVIVSVWGLVALLRTLFGIGGLGTPDSPQALFAPARPSGVGGGGGRLCTSEVPCSDGVGFCNSPCCPDNPTYPAGCDNVDN